jgi:prepilin-type N-terminal cleavage/methylation domain-containing protein
MRERGFSLIELLIAVLVLGIVAVLAGPVFSFLSSAQRQAWAERQRVVNQQIVNGLLAYAQTRSPDRGKLPAPYTVGSFHSAVVNPQDADPGYHEITLALVRAGVGPNEIADDGSVSANVRVYQRVDGLKANVPLYLHSGPATELTYEFGVVYATRCPRQQACNATLPGSSPSLTSANYTTWNVQGTDAAPVFISSLPLQKEMLAVTARRLDTIRDSLLQFVRAKQLAASATDTTNWYPAPTGLSMAGAAPGTNQGCRDGWYDLSAANVDVLPQVGLSREEYGKTSWGGAIQYCRDFDPTGLKSPNAPPQWAALRILKSVSQGGAPDGTSGAAVPATGGTLNNVFLTF